MALLWKEIKEKMDVNDLMEELEMSSMLKARLFKFEDFWILVFHAKMHYFYTWDTAMYAFSKKKPEEYCLCHKLKGMESKIKDEIYA